jgi:hypothetical protein
MSSMRKGQPKILTGRHTTAALAPQTGASIILLKPARIALSLQIQKGESKDSPGQVQMLKAN